MKCAISGIDHVAITVHDLARAANFYIGLGGLIVREYEIDGRVMVKQLQLGGAMINMHQAGHGHPLVAAKPTPGAVDLCFRWDGPIDDAIAHLSEAGVPIIEGPVARFSSDGTRAQSVYFRDPDANLLELLTTTSVQS